MKSNEIKHIFIHFATIELLTTYILYYIVCLMYIYIHSKHLVKITVKIQICSNMLRHKANILRITFYH